MDALAKPDSDLAVHVMCENKSNNSAVLLYPFYQISFQNTSVPFLFHRSFQNFGHQSMGWLIEQCSGWTLQQYMCGSVREGNNSDHDL
jgi:hypothetical protein